MDKKEIKKLADLEFDNAMKAGKSEEEANQIYKDKIAELKMQAKFNTQPKPQRNIEVTDDTNKVESEYIAESSDIDIPKELDTDDIPDEIKHPLAGETASSKREYASAEINKADNTPIPEADVASVPFDDGVLGNNQQTQPQQKTADGKPIQDNKTNQQGGLPRNPQLDTLDPADKRKAAKNLAEICVNAYVWLNEIAKKNLQYSEFKMQKIQAKGKINILAILDYNIPTEDGEGSQSIRQLIDSYNETLEKIYVCKEEWQQKVISLLTEIFIKKGWGFNEENSLAYYIGKDVIEKVMATIPMVSTLNAVLKSVNEHHLKITKGKKEPVKTEKADIVEEEPITANKKKKQNVENNNIQDAEVIDDKPEN
jgi:hypothetical protein